MLYLSSTISITNLALPAEEPTTDDDVDGAVKGGTTSDDVECGVDDGDGSEVCGGGTMGGGLIFDKGDGAGVNDGDGDGDVWIGWVGDGTDCTTGRKILDESRHVRVHVHHLVHLHHTHVLYAPSTVHKVNT